MNLNEKNTERLRLVGEYRALHETLTAENRVPTADEQVKLDTISSDITKMKGEIDREMLLKTNEKDLAARSGASVRAELDPATPEGVRATPEYKKAFQAWSRHGNSVPMEVKATLQKAVNSQGGYLVPIEYETAIVLKMYDANIMRQLGTVTRTTSQVNIPMEANLPTFGWIGELGTFPATDTTVAQQILAAWKLGGIISVSEELMEDAFIDVGDYVAGRASLSAGFAEEASFIVGDGNQKPTGWVTTVGASGVTVTTASNANVTSIDMFALMYAVPRPYRKNASFIVADSVLSKLRQEKSTTGQYLWMPALTANAPDVYLGKSIYTSDFLAAFAPGSVSAGFGDFSYYQIVDRVGWSMQRLNELYAANGQVGFRMWERTDGKLLRPEAVVTLTTHA